MSAKYPVKPGPFKPHPNSKYVTIIDNQTGQPFLARVSADGSLAAKARVHSGMSNYTSEQWAIVSWCIWKRYDGWSCREIARIVQHFWYHEPGQTPFIPVMVATWWSIHCLALTRGEIWPG